MCNCHCGCKNLRTVSDGSACRQCVLGSHEHRRIFVTDWKQVADEMFMVIVGMASANAQINGRDVQSAIGRMDSVRADVIAANTKAA